MKKRYCFFIIFLSFVVLLISGCSLPWSKKNLAKNINNDVNVVIEQINNSGFSGQMKKFSDYQELKLFLDSNILETIKYCQNDSINQHVNSNFIKEKIFSENSFQVIKKFFTKNNIKADVQAKDVDEADIIKASGNYIYALVYQDLYIIETEKVEETKVVSKISFNSRPSNIYLYGQKLIVIGNDDQLITSSVYQNFRRQSPYTFVKIFDISNPVNPKQIRDLIFEGSYRDSRLINGRLYLIINNYNVYIPGENIVPRLVDNGKILTNNCSTNDRCFAPDVYYFDLPYDIYNFVSINSLDLNIDNDLVAAQTYILNSAQNIYLFADNFFIFSPFYFNDLDLRLKVMQNMLSDKLSSEEKDQFNKINNIDSNILNNLEKKQKLVQLFQNFLNKKSSSELIYLQSEIESAFKKEYDEQLQNLEKTIVYKLSLSGSKPVYQANFSIPGIILNNFVFFADINSNLILITKQHNNCNNLINYPNSYSLYILSPDLQLISKLENLISDKIIDSALFLGKSIYFFSSQNNSPLLAVDLSDFKAPKLLKEFRFPDSVDYFSFYNQNILIGLGQNNTTDSYGNIKHNGLKLSLFDVSKPINFSELDSYIINNAADTSLTLLNQRSFLSDIDKNLLIIPTVLISSKNKDQIYFSGALSFSLEQSKFILKSQIDHSDGGKYRRHDANCGSYCYDNSVQRIFYFKDRLYTFSNKYLKVNDLNNFQSLASVKLIPDTVADFEIESLSDENMINNLQEESPKNNQLPLGPYLPEELKENNIESNISNSSELSTTNFLSENGIIINNDKITPSSTQESEMINE